MFRRKTKRQKRDEAIGRAHDHLHLAIHELRLAHAYAASMGDQGFATALWEIGDLIPAVSREVGAYVYDWQARIQPPRYEPIVAVRYRESSFT